MRGKKTGFGSHLRPVKMFAPRSYEMSELIDGTNELEQSFCLVDIR